MIAVAIVAVLISGTLGGRYRWICLANARVCDDVAGKIERQIADPTRAGLYPPNTPLGSLRENASRLRRSEKGWRLAAAHPRITFDPPAPILSEPPDPAPTGK